MGEMSEASDAQLLRDYVEHGHEAAFREIVARHTDAVYSAALRQVSSPDLACDVAQSVFTDLARKAPSLARTLDARASLVGWLYRSTRFAALNQWRDDQRRQARERLAMQHFDPVSDPAPEWARAHATNGYLIEAKRWLLLHEAQADAFALKP
jgi:DNA-directed RNA polymerase specialized sigma24 family protein